MGCFGYICKGCNTSIPFSTFAYGKSALRAARIFALLGNCFTGGEKCVMIHVRHGKELGRVEGYYDEYGRVADQAFLPEDKKYRGNSPGVNGHSEICKSEFELDDSSFRLEGLRVYNGREVAFYDYAAMKRDEIADYLRDEVLAGLKADERREVVNLAKVNRAAAGALARRMLFEASLDSKQMMKEYNELPVPERNSYSGTVAWHQLCYRKATEAEKSDLTPSKSDPNQSWGKIRKKYS